jgi:hypothetical protein
MVEGVIKIHNQSNFQNNEPQLPDDVNSVTSPPLAMPNTYRPEHLRIPEETKKTIKRFEPLTSLLSYALATYLPTFVNFFRKATDVPQAISKRRKKISNTISIATGKDVNDDNTFFFSDDIYKAYKDYYLGEKIKLKLAFWTKREIPEWITSYVKEANITIPALSKAKDTDKKSKKKKQ